MLSISMFSTHLHLTDKNRTVSGLLEKKLSVDVKVHLGLFVVYFDCSLLVGVFYFLSFSNILFLLLLPGMLDCPLGV